MPAPKRRWLQLHLSTCIVLMFVAGGLLWANIYCFRVVADAVSYGWPVNAYRVQTFYGEAETDTGEWLPFVSSIEKKWILDWEFWKHGFRNGGVLTNALVAALVLVAAGASLEWFIRRRERRP